MTLLIGQLAALSAALFWALATLLYNRSSLHLSAAQLNLVKGMVACPLLLISLLLFGHQLPLDPSSPALWLLLLSGVIGITIGDTCYFAALRRLGPWHTILLEYLAPPLAAVIAWVFLGEILTLLEIIAAFTVIAGVIFVLTEKRMTSVEVPGQLSRSGLAFAVTAAWCQASGLVMAFHALQSFEVNAMQAALIRLGGGTLALTAGLLIFAPRLFKSTWGQVRKTRVLPLMSAIFMGTFLAIWLQQIAIAYVTPGIAQTLLATAPLFMIAINMLYGRGVSARALTGTLLALLGIALLFLR
ncbi:DMT family transporter [Aliidiomarina minuta]|nr:DMT family transporter [Aliidiomarina minuta]